MADKGDKGFQTLVIKWRENMNGSIRRIFSFLVWLACISEVVRVILDDSGLMTFVKS